MNLFVQIGAPSCITALDLLIRNGFGLSVIDAGADMTLVALSGIILLALDESAGLRLDRGGGSLMGAALVLLVAWVFCLWLIANQPGTITGACIVMIGVFALLWFFRECLIIWRGRSVR